MSNIRNPLAVIQVIDASYNKLLDKPVLDSSSTSALSYSNNEVIQNTIKLHKISKTGTSTDLVDSNTLIRTTEFNALGGRVTTAEEKISVIESKIPSAASSSNPLADKQYVIDTFQGSIGYFRGNWSTWSNVPTDSNDYPADATGSKVPHTNDYIVVIDASGYNSANKGTWRFKYNGVWATNGKNGWLPEYQINEEPLTSDQLAALNSGITSTLVGQITTNQNNITSLTTRMGTAEENITTLGTNLNTVSGKVDTNAADIISINTALTGKQDVISDLSTIRSQAGSALQPGDNISELVNNSGFITGITDTMITTALGYTPYNSTNPSGYQTSTQVSNSIADMAVRYDTGSQSLTDTQKLNARTNIGAGTSSFSGVYGDLSNKPLLNTTYTTALSTSSNETISGTISLHKISKTGTSTDLVDSTDLIRTTEFNVLGLRVTSCETNITSIAGKIPSAASSTNKLVDTDSMNTAINNLAAYYITSNAQGDPFATKAALTNATTFYSRGVVRVPTTNDYCIVLADESKQSATGGNPTTRYSYQGTQWEYQYTISDVPLTSDQLAALNSGITSTLVGQITTNQNNISSLSTSKQDVISDLSTIRSQAGSALQPNDNITSLTNNAGYTKVEASSTNGYIKIDGTETKVYELPNNIATTSDIPTKVSDLNNDSGFITGITDTMITTALGYTPYDSTNPSGYISGITDTMITTALGYTPYDSSNPSGYTKVEVSSTNGYIKINGTETKVYELPSDVVKTDNTGKISLSLIPASAITETFIAANQAAMLALSNATIGDICVRTDLNKTFILKADPYSTLANWQELLTPTCEVTSVNTKTGVVVLNGDDVTSVRYDTTSQGLNDTQKSNARTNINAQETISDLSTIRSQAGSAIQPNDNVSSLTNDAGYITTVTDTMITTALGYTPYSSSNPSSYQTSTQVSNTIANIAVRYDTASQGLNSTQQSNARANIGAGTSDFSGSYSDLSNKPTLGTAAALNTGTSAGNIPVVGSDGKLDSSIIPVTQITVDSALSSTSENPVQNKVINSALLDKQPTIDSSHKLSADLVDDTSTTNKFVTSTDITNWNAKQNALTTAQLDAVNSGVTSDLVDQLTTWRMRKSGSNNYMKFATLDQNGSNDLLVTLAIHRGGNNAEQYSGVLEIRGRWGGTGNPLVYFTMKWAYANGFTQDAVVANYDTSENVVNLYIKADANQDYYFTILSLATRGTKIIKSTDVTSVTPTIEYKTTYVEQRKELLYISSTANNTDYTLNDSIANYKWLVIRYRVSTSDYAWSVIPCSMILEQNNTYGNDVTTDSRWLAFYILRNTPSTIHIIGTGHASTVNGSDNLWICGIN